MSIISLVLIIAAVGLVVWLVLQIPMPAIFQKVIMAVAALALIVWLLQQLGFVPGLTRINIP